MLWADDSTAMLSWTAPGDDGDRGQAEEYDLRRHEGGAPEDWTLATPVPLPRPRPAGSEELARMSGLASDQIHFFAVRARDLSDNWSEFSNVVQANIGDPEPPAQVTDLHAADLAPHALTLEFTAPGDDGDRGRAVSYEFRSFSSNITEATWNEAHTWPDATSPQPAGSPETVRLVGLEPETTVHFAMRARDNSGKLSPISNDAVVTLPRDTVPPSAVQDLVVKAEGAFDVTLRWTAPGNDGAEGQAAAYRLRYGPEPISEETWETAVSITVALVPAVSGSPESLRVSELPGGATLWFAIRATDERGNFGPVSNPGSAMVTRLPRCWAIRPDGGGDAPTIQAAIDSSVDGDTVFVSPGTYYENITIEARDILLTSASGPSETTIDGSRSESAVVNIGAVSRAMVLEGFRLTGGCSTGGGGIVILSGSPVIRGNIIEKNDCTSLKWGGGMLCTTEPSDLEHAPLIEDNVFSDNHGRFGGAAMFGSGSATFRGNLVKRNSSDYDGGGLFIWLNLDHILVEDNTFIENDAGDHGGAIAAWNAGAGGGAATVDIVGNLMLRNRARGEDAHGLNGSGGAIHAGGRYGSIVRNTIVYNEGQPPCGGRGITLDGRHGVWLVQRNIIAFNKNGGLSCFSNPVLAKVRENLLYENGSEYGCGGGECGSSLEFTNWVGDPLFCDPANDDFHLAANSPALGGILPIGAFSEAGCDAKRAELIVPVAADAFVCSDDWANRNFGTSSNGYSPRAVGKQNAFTGFQIGRQYYRFNVPEGSPEVKKVYLRLKVKDNGAGFPYSTAVYGATDDWSESGITWNNQPGPNTAALDQLSASCCGTVYYYDVTAYAMDRIARSDRSLSFVQAGANESNVGGLRWWQREGDGHSVNGIVGEAPELWINPVAPLSSPLPGADRP
jgi:hypothetical protein